MQIDKKIIFMNVVLMFKILKNGAQFLEAPSCP